MSLLTKSGAQVADWKFAKREDIPEDIRDEAKEVDGGFVVSVVGKAKLTQFRDNNIALAQERDRLKAANEVFAKLGDDPEKLARELSELRDTAQLVKDGKLKGSDAVSAEVQDRLKSAKDAYEAQIKELGTKLSLSEARAKEVDGKFKRSIIDREVTNAVLSDDSGVNPAALPDVLARAYNIYQVTDDGKLVPKNGDAVVYGQDGVTPMLPKEWLGKVLEVSPYLAKQSAGGGAAGGDGKNLKHGMTEAEFDALPGAEQVRRARAAR